MPEADRIAKCATGSRHLKALVGLMNSRGVRISFASSTTDHGVEWGTIIACGSVETELLRRAAELVVTALQDDADRLAAEAERN
jgi:hypothetical protein